jgi:hypothetical protein
MKTAPMPCPAARSCGFREQLRSNCILPFPICRVTEGISGASVGTITFTDPDFGDRHTMTVDDSRFEIVGSELRLKTGQSLNYASENTISVNVTVTDLNGAFSSANFLS